MPPDGKPQLAPDDITLIRWWIDAGADAKKAVAEANPTPIVSRIVRDRLGQAPAAPAAALAQTTTPPQADPAAPSPQKDVAPAVADLSRDLRLPLTVLGEKESWLQANAGVLGAEFGDAELAAGDQGDGPYPWPLGGSAS